MYAPDFIPVVMLTAWSLVTIWAWGATLRDSLGRTRREFVLSLTGSMLAVSVTVCLLLIVAGSNVAVAASLPLGVAMAGGVMQRIAVR